MLRSIFEAFAQSPRSDASPMTEPLLPNRSLLRREEPQFSELDTRSPLNSISREALKNDALQYGKYGYRQHV